MAESPAAACERHVEQAHQVAGLKVLDHLRPNSPPNAPSAGLRQRQACLVNREATAPAQLDHLWLMSRPRAPMPAAARAARNSPRRSHVKYARGAFEERQVPGEGAWMSSSDPRYLSRSDILVGVQCVGLAAVRTPGDGAVTPLEWVRLPRRARAPGRRACPCAGGQHASSSRLEHDGRSAHGRDAGAISSRGP